MFAIDPGMNRVQAKNFTNTPHNTVRKVLDLNPASVFILGDFNDQCVTWESEHTNELKQDLLHTAISLGLYQLINESLVC